MDKQTHIEKDYKALEKILGDVISSGKYQDIKYVLDLRPKSDLGEIIHEYKIVKKDPSFDIKEFVGRHFSSLSESRGVAGLDKNKAGINEYIYELWDDFTVSSRSNKGSLIGLPHKYVVPGGRFSEQFYWDSYFIILGLSEQGRWDLVESMIKNFAYMINKFGFIPSANRKYFLTRSQPPFFSLMVELLAKHSGEGVYKKYLKQMRREYDFWMSGERKKLRKAQHKAFARIVEMPAGEILNRYYDNKKTPRPESINKDEVLSSKALDRDPERLYLHVRAAAESGWDFSSRWFTDDKNMKTIRTADMIPIDLNSLMYKFEKILAKSYKIAGKDKRAKEFTARANTRKAVITKYCWSDKDGFFSDYDFYTNIPTGRLSLAGVYPLFVGIATKTQAKQIASRLEKDFLKAGGLVSTLHKTSQQWDYPNGWAPLHWVVVEGLIKYGYKELALKIAKRWLKTVEGVYKKDGKLVEKYDVVNPGVGTGGEYNTQEGFGWTNGVHIALNSVVNRSNRDI